MNRQSWCILAVLGVLAVSPTLAVSSQPALRGFLNRVASGLEPSDIDTLRIISTWAETGDSFYIDLDVVNVDTVGGYAARIRFDPSVIEPLTDTLILANDTIISVEASPLRDLAFEEFGASLQEPGVVIFGAFDIDADTSEVFLPGSGVAVRFHWRALHNATPQVTPVVFENDPVFPQSWNTITDLHGIIFKRPVLTSGSVTVTQKCDCPYPGDLDANGLYDAIDLNALIDILFFGGVNLSDPDCPVSRVDWNCDGVPDALDLNDAIAHMFFIGAGPCDPCP